MTTIDQRSTQTVVEVAPTGRVAVVGLGYVGLPTALALFQAGTAVVGIDVSGDRLAAVRSGIPDLLPGDMALLRQARHSRDRFAVTSDEAAIGEADAVIVCVPTPVDASLTPDLTMLQTACASVVKHARPGQTLVLTSTSYVGCTRELLVEPLRHRGLEAGANVHVAFSPERINPGSDGLDHYDVPRVVGGATPACVLSAARFLSRTVRDVHVVSSMEAAELVKLLENTFRAVNISLANEFSDVARHLQLDAVEVIEAAATKPYGFMPFYPGPGVGGHCIPCDPHYLLWQLRREHVHPPLIASAMQSISERPARIVARAVEILAEAGKTPAGSRVLVVGVAYKPDVADTRESPALQVIAGLERRGVSVLIHDPVVGTVKVADKTYPSVDPASVAGCDADLVVVCCLHSATGVALPTQAPILDATYRLPQTRRTFVP